MRIKELKLYTNRLELEKEFYTKTLGFEVIESNANTFSLKIGWSKLTFEQSEISHNYHYCFLIPCNKLTQALEWLEQKTDVIEVENGRKIQHFNSWKADSVYFYDASGNVVEFIVRHELNNSNNSVFSLSDVLCLNEIGLPTSDINKLNHQLQENLGTEFWRGDRQRFGTNGSLEGLFLLPNYHIKDTWFPTSIKIKPESFSAVILNKGEKYLIEYKKAEIKCTPHYV